MDAQSEPADLRVDPRHVLPVVEAGAYLGASRGKTYELVRAGNFPVPVLKVGGRLRVRKVDLLRVLGLDGSPSGNAA